MVFGNPSGLWWALLAVPVISLYLLRGRPRRVPVSTVSFWNEVFEDVRPRSLWRRLRHPTSLVVQLAFLTLLVVALAEPHMTWQRLQPRRVVVVVDNSASMNATDVLPSRLAVSREAGHRIINELGGDDCMAIVTAGCTPRVQIGMTSHLGTLHASLDAVPATDGPTRVKEALQTARRLLGDYKNTEIDLLSDGCFAGCDEINRAADVRRIAVGKPTGNVAITTFQVRRSLMDPIGYQVLVEVANFSYEPVACRLEIQRIGNPVDVIPLKLGPNERVRRILRQKSAEGCRLLARIDRTDALVMDNQAVAILPRRTPQPVILVSEGCPFLERVLEAIPAVALKVTNQLPDRFPEDAVLVLHRKMPRKLPPGNLLVVDPEGATDAWQAGEPLRSPLAGEHASRSPLMTHVRLENVFMPEARRLVFSDKPTVLLKAVDGSPLYCSFERPSGKLLVFCVNVARGDLPLRTVFPIMISNALSWFRDSCGELLEAASTGDPVRVELAPLVQGSADARGLEPRLVLRRPDGTSRPLPRSMLEAAPGPLDQCGIWTIAPLIASPGGAAGSHEPPFKTIELACNLANAAESDLRVTRSIAPGPGTSLAVGSQPAWFYLVAAAFVLSVTEWCLYHRRWIA